MKAEAVDQPTSMSGGCLFIRRTMTEHLADLDLKMWKDVGASD